MFLFGIICAYALPPLWGRIELSSFVMCTNQNIHPFSPHTCLRVRITWESFRILMLRQHVRPVTLESVRGGCGPRWFPWAAWWETSQSALAWPCPGVVSCEARSLLVCCLSKKHLAK